MKEQILKLKSQGKTYSEIAKILNCSKGTISYHCGKGQKEKSRIRQIRNKANKLSKQKQTRKDVKSFINRYKRMKGCNVCGIKDERVLECDHLIPSEKEFKISELGKHAHSIELLKSEMRKCQILCANCHRIKTFEQNNWSKD